jgi:hypothetical protein
VLIVQIERFIKFTYLCNEIDIQTTFLVSRLLGVSSS